MCLEERTKKETSQNGTLIWTSTQVSFIFSAMFWGGLVTSFAAGWSADRYGAKNILLACGLIHCFGSFATPIIALNAGFPGLMAVRFLMGLGQGVMMPCLGSLMSRWFPPSERSTVIAIYTSGNQVAAIIANPIGALLCGARSFLGGWPAIFYVFGTVGVVWCVCWWLLVSNSPEKNRRISNAELAYLQDTLKNQSLQNRKVATKKIPFRQMLLSGPLWANVCTNCTAACFMTVYQSYLPTYFKQVLFMNIRQNGLLCALPYIVQMTFKLCIASFADALKKRKPDINHTMLCKIFNSIAAFGTALSMIAVSSVDCTQTAWAIVFTCLSYASFSNFASGFMTSAVSIAPVYTGMVNSFSRVFAQFGQISGPYIVGFFVKQGTRNEWQHVQWILAAMLTIGGVIYLIFGSAEIQPWAKAPQESQLPLCATGLSVVSLENRGQISSQNDKNDIIYASTTETDDADTTLVTFELPG